ncbi:MAG: class IV adenylate cyclase [Haloarculaceae archaeon]
MYEVEVKVRATHEAVRERLREAGADPAGSVVQEDTYYDAPHRDFAETDEALRVRTERRDDEATVALTYKGPLVDEGSKTREEFETAVADGEAAAGILDGLGFEPAATVRKERERWSLAGFTVTLDSVDGLGEFVEVETETERESAVESARDGARDLLERLGLDPDDGIRTSYLGLLLDESEG